MNKPNKSFLIRGIVVFALPVFFAACQSSSLSSLKNSDQSYSASCAGNVYLMKYDCDIDRIQHAASNGSADAQYALGYMYYYGIDTVRDQSTAELWIKRAAAQGQPLAKKAWSLIHSGEHVSDFHHVVTRGNARSGGGAQRQAPADVALMNAAVPESPIGNHLPGYNSGSAKKPAVIDSLKRQKTTQSPAANTRLTPTSSKKTSTPKMQTSMAPKKPPFRITDPRLHRNAKPIVAASVRQAKVKRTKALLTKKNTDAKKQVVQNKNDRLFAMDGRRYTLQLIGSHHLSVVKNFMRAHQIVGKSNYYETKLSGKPWFIVIYGNYPSAMRANAALHRLPAALKIKDPWVKSFTTVQREVRTQKVVS